MDHIEEMDEFYRKDISYRTADETADEQVSTLANRIGKTLFSYLEAKEVVKDLDTIRKQAEIMEMDVLAYMHRLLVLKDQEVELLKQEIVELNTE